MGRFSLQTCYFDLALTPNIAMVLFFIFEVTKAKQGHWLGFAGQKKANGNDANETRGLASFHP